MKRLSYRLARVIHLFIPALPVRTPLGFVLLALGVSLVVGLASGILPARRAAALDPVLALGTEQGSDSWAGSGSRASDSPPSMRRSRSRTATTCSVLGRK